MSRLTWHAPESRFFDTGLDRGVLYTKNKKSFTPPNPSAVTLDAAWSSDGRYMALAHTSAPFVSVYKQHGDGMDKMNDPSVKPSSTAYSAAWSPDDQYVAFAHTEAPYVTVYKLENDTLIKIADPVVTPTGVAHGVSWSPNGLYLAVSHFSSPYLTVYKLVGGGLTKIANPATLPAGNSLSVDWSSDSQYLAIAHNTSPFVTVYKRSGDVLTKISNPATLPAGQGRGVAWSQDRLYLAVAHDNAPYLSIFKRSGDVLAKLSVTIPAGPTSGRTVSWSDDGLYLSFGQLGSPTFTTFRRDGDEFEKIINPSPLPTGEVFSVEWFKSKLVIAVSSTPPFVDIYEHSGNTFTPWKVPITVPWSGLTGVEEQGGDGAAAYYIDGRPFLFLPKPKEYQATLRAFTYPDEFAAVMGIAEIADGMYLDSQPSEAFDLSYRTLVGNATQGIDHGYKIHLVYNATVTPQAMSYDTLSSSINPTEFSWDIQAVPVKVEGFRPTAHIIIDTRHMDQAKIDAVESLIYGNDVNQPEMPAPQAVFDLLSYGDTIIVTDMGDGTFTVEGSYENVYMTGPGIFQVDNVDGVDHGDGTFTISSTNI